MPPRWDLRRLDSRAVPQHAAEIRAFLLVRNEIQRLPLMLTHHRTLGVHRFFVVDNGSVDGTLEYLRGEPDVHLFETSGSYQDARNGIDWIEMLLHVYGADTWCLLLDADEQLVYPECETVRLPEFCGALEERGLNCLVTSFVDMYGDRPIADTHLDHARPPIEICRFFDPHGYYHLPSSASLIPRMFGGPRARLFWPEIDLAAYARDVPCYIERAFDQTAYVTAHSDVAAEIREGRLESAVQHFSQYGRFERRSVTLRAVPEWPEHNYLALYPDVRQGIMDGTFSSGLDHFVRYGQFEGRLLWTSGPPCISQVPLLRYDHDVAVGIGRHVLAGGTWRRWDAVGGVLLHFKLTDALVPLGRSALDDPTGRQASTWTSENRRYREVIARIPTLTALAADSVAYRDPQQLVELGIITPLSAL
jgi:glycosyltransferase involved in cell wall biosynthesis